MSNVIEGYRIAKEIYAKYGVDVDAAIKKCNDIPLSIHCWQGDDCAGFENPGGSLTGGIQVTGNYPGKATTAEQLRADLVQAMKFIPGVKKINIHAFYLESDTFVDRDQIEPKHFEKWADWAVENNLGIDFNGTFFSHEKSSSGYTLSSANENVRKFWIEHGKRVRKIAQYFYERTGVPCVNNIWIPDGEKEVPVDTLAPRQRLIDSLNQILETEYDGVIDSVESKVFGIGSEAYVVGSHEFYLGYAFNNKNTLITMDTGHYHPTEMVSAKISGIAPFVDGLLLHVSRPVRWDSDHVVNFDDETRAIMFELVSTGVLEKTYLALDYFDASINRIFAWVIGSRNTRKALLEALLSPIDVLKKLENAGDKSSRLAYIQELKTLPFSLIWNYYCANEDCGESISWVDQVKKYETDVMLKR